MFVCTKNTSGYNVIQKYTRVYIIWVCGCIACALIHSIGFIQCSWSRRNNLCPLTVQSDSSGDVLFI